MELIEKSMSSLFEQLGEPSDEASIARFIEVHGSLSGELQLHEASFWSASQAGFLREAKLQDSAWSHVVDALNIDLHRQPAV